MGTKTPPEEWVEVSKKTVKDFQYLWKLDDADWVAQRQADWDKLVKTTYKEWSKSEVAVIKLYFLKGELTEYIDHITKLYSTPYQTKEELTEVFYSRLIGGGGERQDTLSRFLFFYKDYRHMPWAFDHSNLFVQCFFSGDYIVLKEQTSINHVAQLTPPPDSWVSKFLGQTCIALDDKFDDHPYYDCISYFLNAFPVSADLMLKKGMRKRLDLIWQIDTKNLPEKGKQFVENMRRHKVEIEQKWEKIEWN